MGSVLERHSVHITGKGEKTLVLAHGFGTDQSIWKAQVETFAPYCKLVLFNLAGSKGPEEQNYNPRRYSTLYAYASDLVEICRALELENAIYIGHSVSGMIGLLACLLDRKPFSSLVLIGASPRYLNDQDYYGGFEQADVDSLFQEVSRNYYAWASGFAPQAMKNPEQPELAQHYAASLQAIRPDIAVSVLRTIFQSDHREELARIQAPCHILQTDDDVAVPVAVGQYLAEHIPQASLVRLQASGHLPHVSAPEEVNQAIAKCLIQ